MARPYFPLLVDTGIASPLVNYRAIGGQRADIEAFSGPAVDDFIPSAGHGNDHPLLVEAAAAGPLSH